MQECPHCTPDGSFPNQDGRICPFCKGKHDLDEIEYEQMEQRFNEWLYDEGGKAMDLKDTKIYITEIPKEWTQRTRAGHTNIWNERFYRNGLPEVKLDPPTLGLYAERFEDGWYWVCGCSKCLDNGDPFPYIVCNDHNRCETCGIHRNELKEKGAWGVRGGWQCYSCHNKEHEERKNEAIKAAKKQGHSEDDCYYTHEIICPVCASKCSSDDMYEAGEHETTCGICDTDFDVVIEYEVRYTSRLRDSAIGTTEWPSRRRGPYKPL